MKANLSFDLDEEREEFDITLKANKYHSALDEIRLNLREELTHNKDAYSEEEIELLVKVQKKFYNILNDYDINEFK